MNGDTPHQRITERRLHAVGCGLKVLKGKAPSSLAGAGPGLTEQRRDLGPGQADELLGQTVQVPVRDRSRYGSRQHRRNARPDGPPDANMAIEPAASDHRRVHPFSIVGGSHEYDSFGR
jgi:hypothetical protein